MLFLSALAALAIAPPADDYLATWNALEQTIEKRYYARQKRKTEMDERLARYAPLCKAAKSREQFQDFANAMIAEFHDSHFEFDVPGDQNYYLMDSLISRSPTSMPNIGAWFKKTSSGYIVSMVLDGSAAEEAGLHKGDLMVGVDGKPFSPVSDFASDVDKKARIEFVEGGKTLNRDAQVADESALRIFLDATRKSVKVATMKDGRKFGYIRPWALLGRPFLNSISEAIAGPLASTQGLILDLRDGFGGSFNEFYRFFAGPDGIRYRGPLAILINEGSRSAREALSFLLQREGRAVLIGRHTPGYVLGTFPVKLNAWATLELPVSDVELAGVRLEGLGVKPDIAVSSEYGKNYADLDVQAAEDYLLRHTEPIDLGIASRKAGSKLDARVMDPVAPGPNRVQRIAVEAVDFAKAGG